MRRKKVAIYISMGEDVYFLKDGEWIYYEDGEPDGFHELPDVFRGSMDGKYTNPRCHLLKPYRRLTGVKP